jgi:hypothetical protein
MSNQYKKDTTDIDRFLSKIEIEDKTDCWIWIGCTFGDGYGAFYYFGNNVRAHKFSFEYFHEIIVPEGLLVCHIPPCHNPRCVNPLHLKLGTPQDNMDDKVFEGRESHFGRSGPNLLIRGELNGNSLVNREMRKSNGVL